MSDFGPDKPALPQAPSNDRKILLALTGALAAWGVYLALGAFFGGFGKGNLSVSALRSLVVLACMGGFLGLWWLLMLGRRSREAPDAGQSTRRFQYSLRTLLVVTAMIALGVAYYVSSQKMWDKTNRQNAISSYWTMRTNLEMSRKSISPEDYQQLRQKIDQSWKALNPDLEIPDAEPETKSEAGGK
jgi:hypothetical protein